MLHCAVPGCFFSRKRKKEGEDSISLFKIYLPQLARTEQEKNHREELTKFILKLRDPTQGDRIKDMLHRETAALCEKHFDPKDVFLKGNRKSLRLGAIPHSTIKKSCTKKAMILQEASNINLWQKMFFLQQRENAQRSPFRRRYHPDIIRWAIEMYAKSSAAYEQLRISGVLTLPSAWTLRQYRNFASGKPGISQLAILQMDKFTADVQAYITVDEMKIKENLVYREGKLVGFVDFAGRKCELKIATQICMFYLRAFKKDISIPISWFPTTITPAHQLASMFWECLGVCETRHVLINAIVADGSAVNRKFFDILHGGKQTVVGEFTFDNPYRPEKPIFICSDTSHLLKTARNSLYSSKPTGTKYLNKCGRDILWTHIRTLFEKECSSPLRKTKLSATHMDLGSFNKMKVTLARETLHRRVGKALEQDVDGSAGTAEFVFIFDKWFEIMNCGVKNKIKSGDDERLVWLKQTFVQYLLDWQNEVETLHPGEEKRLIARPTLKGLIFSTLNAIALTKRLLQDGLEYVCLGILTQDVLEGTFGNLRMMGRTCTNPDVNQVKYGIMAISQRRVMKRKAGANTAYGRRNPWTIVCDELLPRRPAKRAKKMANKI